ncbi:transglycosylase-like protein with SLT domain [Krasilnikovia cinnamomea]|uniref:Transglycosylase-like protein with SLT domain n=1 Tax=Krasilnikovia cinnamomea TaxID=349313 RepID=A0A4V6MG66_9ACTN|nr:lytic transglycosylase domain-containing protein [Krasilnikovia cinnamomea]RZU53046.1 transglycosylase-like protein with SLT domain [Krasilnikovia cinnamomea]
MAGVAVSRAGWVVGAVVAVVLAAGCGLGRHDDNAGSAAPAPVDLASSEPVVPVVTESPAPEPSTASPTASRTAPTKPKAKTKTKAAPTEDPNNFQAPACAKHEGVKVSKSKAKSALNAAAGKSYWPTSAPSLKLPARLVLATAWHESGWQSDIVNCDGGRGLMQVMPDTQKMINDRFGQAFDAHDYRQNAVLGANYLAWLTKYFGDKYFKENYSLKASDCRSHSSVCLLNVVIAAYNAGFGTAEAALGDKQLPNPEYVDSVRSLMASCYCDRY